MAKKESRASFSIIAIEKLATVVTDHHSQLENHLNLLICHPSQKTTENTMTGYDHDIAISCDVLSK